MDNVENLILEQLRYLRAGQDRIETAVGELGRRMISLERSMARQLHESADLYSDMADQHSRYDKLAERLERVERRLEIRDEP